MLFIAATNLLYWDCCGITKSEFWKVESTLKRFFNNNIQFCYNISACHVTSKVVIFTK